MIALASDLIDLGVDLLLLGLRLSLHTARAVKMAAALLFTSAVSETRKMRAARRRV